MYYLYFRKYLSTWDAEIKRSDFEYLKSNEAIVRQFKTIAFQLRLIKIRENVIMEGKYVQNVNTVTGAQHTAILIFVCSF